MSPETDVIYNSSTDPCFNLATEEYLLDREDDRPVFMLWRDAAAVIIGRNQNAYAEVNEPFIRDHNIKVVRRLTGGGAVFHDDGNINYTFIAPDDGTKTLDFAGFTAPIIAALRSIGVKAELSGRNDIVVDGRKISGSAQCVRNGRVLHHGSILWSADLSHLVGALNVDPEKIASKGIGSVRSRVANLRNLIGSDMDASGFMEFLFASCASAPRVLTEDEVAAISAIRDAKYATWEWNWGKSKSFSIENKKRYPFGSVEIRCDADGGVIGEIEICGDFFGSEDTAALCDALRGVRMENGALTAALSDVGNFIAGATPEMIAGLILGE